MTTASARGVQVFAQSSAAPDTGLETVAARIVEHVNASDDHLIEAALELVAVKRRFDNGEFEPLAWSQWTREQLNLRETRVAELMRIGCASEPREELVCGRAKNAARQSRNRAKQQRAAAHVRSVSDNAAPLRNAETEVEGDAEKLIAWARSARREQIRRVLDFIETMEAA